MIKLMINKMSKKDYAKDKPNNKLISTLKIKID